MLSARRSGSKLQLQKNPKKWGRKEEAGHCRTLTLKPQPINSSNNTKRTVGVRVE